MIHSFEKRGVLDLSVTGHTVDRPASVKRGEEPDRIEVQHEAFSVFRPNAVTARAFWGTSPWKPAIVFSLSGETKLF